MRSRLLTTSTLSSSVLSFCRSRALEPRERVPNSLQSRRGTCHGDPVELCVAEERELLAQVLRDGEGDDAHGAGLDVRVPLEQRRLLEQALGLGQRRVCGLALPGVEEVLPGDLGQLSGVELAREVVEAELLLERLARARVEHLVAHARALGHEGQQHPAQRRHVHVHAQQHERRLLGPQRAGPRAARELRAVGARVGGRGPHARQHERLALHARLEQPHAPALRVRERARQLAAQLQHRPRHAPILESGRQEGGG